MPIDVYTLVGLKGFDVSVACLESFTKNCRDDFRLQVYSDGTLGQVERARLEALKNTTCLPEGAGREAVATLLARYPCLKREYAAWFFYKKLVDIPLIAGGRFAYIDSDIFFLGPFSGLFVPQPARNRMTEDVAISPGVRDLLGWGRPIHGNLNAGLCQGTTPDYDLIEKFLAYSRDSKPQLGEQICWQVGWSAAAIDLIPLSEVRIAYRYEGLPANLAGKLPIAFHMTFDRKKYLPDLMPMALPVDGPARCVRVRLQQPRLPWMELARKVWGRLLGLT